MRIEDEIKQKKFVNEFEKLTINLLFTSHWLNFRQKDTFKPYDLTPQQYNILRILRGQHPQPVSVSDIRERMIDKMSDVSRLVDRLMRKRLVGRKECEADRRMVDVSITEEGLQLLKRIDNEQDLSEAVRGLSPEEAAQLNRLLDKLRDINSNTQESV
ncbi:MarR family winged helix-turn-helix transcriptional regulator [Eisenibacter elegans]|uniref:MarR family winged helix-turn-helix transcriptional regulator n=1 Tax=Eisenibacter elegans TaxID=997 RepID=UPI00040A5B7D|nr:MarR family transcriptional regulator [Eisenibacter elegans]